MSSLRKRVAQKLIRMAVIQRNKETKIQRATEIPHIERGKEVQAAYEQIGYPPHHNTKSWYRDIYEFYQNNEC